MLWPSAIVLEEAKPFIHSVIGHVKKRILEYGMLLEIFDAAVQFKIFMLGNIQSGRRISVGDDWKDHYIYGGEGWLGFPDLWSGQKAWWNWCLTPVANFDEVRRAQLAKSNLLTSSLVAPGIFTDVLRSVRMLKREWGVESNEKLPYLFNPWQNCSPGSWVYSGRLAFGKTAALQW